MSKIDKKWFDVLDLILSRTIIIWSLFRFISNTHRYLTQRNSIKKVLESSQDLVNELDNSGFWFSGLKWYNSEKFIFKYYGLDNIQVLSDVLLETPNLHRDTVKRHITDNIKYILEIGDGKKLTQYCNMTINSLNENIIFIKLTPTWLNSFLVSLFDLFICSIVTICMCIIYFVFI